MGQVQSIPPLRMEISNFATSALDIARQNKWSVIFGVTAAWTGWNWFKTARNLPPGPIGLPFIGALYCLTGKIHLDFIRLSNIYGDIISLKFGGKYMVVLNSQRAIKEAFVKTAVFSDRPKSINGFFDFSDGMGNKGISAALTRSSFGQDGQRNAAIQEQIDEICSTRSPTLSDRSKLHLLEATILETMRLSNVSPVTPPHCSESDQVLNGYNIPASTVLIANLYVSTWILNFFLIQSSSNQKDIWMKMENF